MKKVIKSIKLPSRIRGVFFSGTVLLILLATITFAGYGKTDISIKIPTDKTALNECVILIHGMGRTPRSMSEMQDYLTAAGFHTVNLGYPSTSKNIEQIAADYFPAAIEQCLQFQPSSIHFVSHSLGGIVLRTVFKNQKPEKMGRVVMLSPPNQGSEVTDALKDWWLNKWLNGPAGQQLSTNKNSHPNQLGPVDYPVGIITGDHHYFFDFWFSSIIPGPDDGKVSVARAPVEGMSDFLVVHETHPFIMDAEYVQEETLYFLKNEIFRHQKETLPPVSGLDWFSTPGK